jgi:hypothetical protein
MSDENTVKKLKRIIQKEEEHRNLIREQEWEA